MTRRFDGKVAVVTGGGRGMGRAVALRLAREGARVVVAEVNPEHGREVAAEIRDSGGAATEVAGDVSRLADVEAIFGAAVKAYGTVDILVNNAGIGSYGRVSELPVDEFERLMRVNYFSAVYATKAVLPSMLERRRGHIVNLASIAGRIGAPMEAAYSASKFAMVGFTEALAFEVGPAGVGVSMVNPGPVETEFFATRGHAYEGSFPKPVTAERVARAVIDVVEHDGLERVIPASLRPAVAVRHLLPPLYRRGTARVLSKQLRQ